MAGAINIMNDRVEGARLFAEKLRRVYGKAYDKAVSSSKESLGSLKKAGGSIEPTIRRAIDDKVHAAHTMLDELNQSLAQKAVPGFRKQNIVEEKIASKRPE